LLRRILLLLQCPPYTRRFVWQCPGAYATADYRFISQRKRALNEADQYIVCTEPSPDVAKAFSTALSANVAQGPNTEGVTFSQAEAIAQLGKRYATVQLLRDLRFRDCEDFANGIIDKVEYGYRLSRYSALVVTLLGIEMVSGENAASLQARLADHHQPRLR